MEVKYNGITKISCNLFEYCLKEVGGSINNKVWQSSYNSYVAYDYEPFCSDGFVLNLEVIFPTDSHMEFFEQLYNKMAKDINHLEKCFEESYSLNKEETIFSDDSYHKVDRVWRLDLSELRENKEKDNSKKE